MASASAAVSPCGWLVPHPCVQVESVQAATHWMYASHAMPSPYLYWRVLASGRQTSEDRAEVFDREDDLVIVVSDGAGGIRGGALASAALVETARAVAENPTLDVHDPGLWTVLLKEADGTLAAKMAGETTAVVVVVGPMGVTGVSVGDSEAWIITKSIDDLTRSQERARLGSGRAVPVSFQRRSLDGVLLVATDADARTPVTPASIGELLEQLPHPSPQGLDALGSRAFDDERRETVRVRKYILVARRHRDPEATSAEEVSGRELDEEVASGSRLLPLGIVLRVFGQGATVKNDPELLSGHVVRQSRPEPRGFPKPPCLRAAFDEQFQLARSGVPQGRAWILERPRLPQGSDVLAEAARRP